MKVLAVTEKGYLEDLMGFIELLDGVDEAHIVTTEPVDKGFEKVYVVKGLYGDVLDRLPDGLGSYDVVVGVNTRKVLEAVSYAAGKNGIPIVTEVISFEDGFLTRNILSGRGYASYEFKTPIALTIALGKFKGSREVTPSATVELGSEPSWQVVERREKPKTGVDIESAEIVIGVGRGFKEKDDLKLAFELAEAIGGEVGCSRPIAADYKWLGEDRWIGISGKKLRGKLYIAVGISGAPQHIMAANDVKVIVAINKDKNAPIFEYADYGIVGDLYQILPILTKKLREG